MHSFGTGVDIPKRQSSIPLATGFTRITVRNAGEYLLHMNALFRFSNGEKIPHGVGTFDAHRTFSVLHNSVHVLMGRM